jgi:hypothetical protein
LWPHLFIPFAQKMSEVLFTTLLSAKFSWSKSLRSWFRVSRDKICTTFNMPRSALETLNNGEQSLDFTYYEQTTNRFWSPHLAESRVSSRFNNRWITLSDASKCFVSAFSLCIRSCLKNLAKKSAVG